MLILRNKILSYQDTRKPIAKPSIEADSLPDNDGVNVVATSLESANTTTPIVTEKTDVVTLKPH